MAATSMQVPSQPDQYYQIYLRTFCETAIHTCIIITSIFRILHSLNAQFEVYWDVSKVRKVKQMACTFHWMHWVNPKKEGLCNTFDVIMKLSIGLHVLVCVFCKTANFLHIALITKIRNSIP